MRLAFITALAVATLVGFRLTGSTKEVAPSMDGQSAPQMIQRQSTELIGESGLELRSYIHVSPGPSGRVVVSGFFVVHYRRVLVASRTTQLTLTAESRAPLSLRFSGLDPELAVNEAVYQLTLENATSVAAQAANEIAMPPSTSVSF